MKISDDLYLVGGGDGGFNISGAIDSNCYVVDTGDGLWLFDVGFDSLDRIVENITADGLDPREVRSVFVTHRHADHAGALGALGALLPEAELAIAAGVAGAARAADEAGNGLAWAREIGYYPSDFRLAPTRIDLELTDGMTRELGSARLSVIDTPGHCHGHSCFLVEQPGRRALVSGDLVFCGGRIALQNLPDVDIGAHARSVDRLLELDFEALLPGHGVFALERGRVHVERAASSFRSMGLPPNLF